MREEEVFPAVPEVILPPVPSSIVHSEICSYTQLWVPERSTDVYSIPGTVLGVGNSVIKNPDSSLGFLKADILAEETDHKHINKKLGHWSGKEE